MFDFFLIVVLFNTAHYALPFACVDTTLLKFVLKNRLGSGFCSHLSLPKRLEVSMLLPACIGCVPS